MVWKLFTFWFVSFKNWRSTRSRWRQTRGFGRGPIYFSFVKVVKDPTSLLSLKKYLWSIHPATEPLPWPNNNQLIADRVNVGSGEGWVCSFSDTDFFVSFLSPCRCFIIFSTFNHTGTVVCFHLLHVTLRKLRHQHFVAVLWGNSLSIITPLYKWRLQDWEKSSAQIVF